jgi:hypothetical protein
MKKRARKRKPLPFRTKNIYARAFIEESGERTVAFSDRGNPFRLGCAIPSPGEMIKFSEWLTKARAWRSYR